MTTTSLTTLSMPGDLMSSPVALDHALRLAEIFAGSSLIPQHLRGKTSDVLMAIAMAQQLGISPLIVMQSLYVVSGKAGWNAQFMIALANGSGKFRGPIQWRETGEVCDPAYAVTAFAALVGSGDEVNATATMAMAKAEGWTKNTKYASMPQHMLRLRSATLLVRLYAPEVMLGIATADEVIDSTPSLTVDQLMPRPSPIRPSANAVVDQAPAVGPASGSARDVGQAQATEDPFAAEREALVNEIRELGSGLSAETKKNCLTAAKVVKLSKLTPMPQLRDLRSKMLAAVLEAGAAANPFAEPATSTPQKWSDGERREFFGALSRLERPVKDKYDAISAYCEAHDMPRPSLMSQDARVAFVASLAAGTSTRFDFDEWIAIHVEVSSA